MRSRSWRRKFWKWRWRVSRLGHEWSDEWKGREWLWEGKGGWSMAKWIGGEWMSGNWKDGNCVWCINIYYIALVCPDPGPDSDPDSELILILNLILILSWGTVRYKVRARSRVMHIGERGMKTTWDNHSRPMPLCLYDVQSIVVSFSRCSTPIISQYDLNSLKISKSNKTPYILKQYSHR